MLSLYAFTILASGLGFQPIYGVGLEGELRPAPRIRIVASADYADAKKQYLDSGWSTRVSARVEYATNWPLLGLGYDWTHDQTRAYTKDAYSPFVSLGRTLDEGNRVYLDYSPNDGTQNEVKELALRWEYEQRKWGAKVTFGQEWFLDQQGNDRQGNYFGVRVEWRVR